MQKLKTVFTVLCVITPIITIYNLNGILIQDILFLILSPLMFFTILKGAKNKILYIPLIFPLIYVILQLCILVIFKNTEISLLATNTLHYIFYLTLTILFVRSFFDIELAMKVYKFICIFSTLYAFLQFFLATLFNYYLPGTLPFFETIVDDYNKVAISNIEAFRPRSIFGEPAGFGIYVSVFLAINLFKKEKITSKEYLLYITITLGVIITRTSTGILLCILLWAIKLIIHLKHNMKKGFGFIIFVFFGVSISPVLLNIIMKTDTYSMIVEHLFGSEGETLGFGTLNRIGNYSYVFSKSNNTTFELLFGHGMKDLVVYNPGIPRLFFYFGIVGALVWSISYIHIFFHAKWIQRRVLLLMILIAFFSDSLFGIQPTIYFPFIILLSEYGNEKLHDHNKTKRNTQSDFEVITRNKG